jgi:prepilin-type processing-associated H-X9-DG protein
MNPNCEPNSPPDTVLLFETRSGWNQYGGPELLTFDNHQGKGANVLFNDGHFEFIRPKDIGRLKWKAEDANNSK